MTVISWAVEAFWRAFAPGLAKETLPTRTLWTTVLRRRGRRRRRRMRGGAEDEKRGEP